jgi:hypothetical protein
MTPLRFKPGKVRHDNGEDERKSAAVDAIEAWLLGNWLGILGWDGNCLGVGVLLHGPVTATEALLPSA